MSAMSFVVAHTCEVLVVCFCTFFVVWCIPLCVQGGRRERGGKVLGSTSARGLHCAALQDVCKWNTKGHKNKLCMFSGCRLSCCHSSSKQLFSFSFFFSFILRSSTCEFPRPRLLVSILCYQPKEN